MTRRPFDPGLQNERTALAWTRTGLAMLLAVAFAARITADRLSVLAIAVAVVAVPLAIAVLLLASARYRATHRALHTRAALPDGRLPATVTTLVILLAIVELTYVYLA